jgi:hypothetical protein
LFDLAFFAYCFFFAKFFFTLDCFFAASCCFFFVFAASFLLLDLLAFLLAIEVDLFVTFDERALADFLATPPEFLAGATRSGVPVL